VSNTKVELRKYLELELKLISNTSLVALLNTVAFEFRQIFHSDYVNLIIYDPNYEYRRILDKDNIRPVDYSELIFSDNLEILERFYGQPARAIIGPYQQDAHGFMFPDNTATLKGCALLPIQIENNLIGSFNFASARKAHFLTADKIELLQPICDILAICLKNVLYWEYLKHIGLTDGLTGVNNRRYFDQRIYEEIAYTQRAKEPLSCLFFDIDYFKNVNDQYGHMAGDLVLKEVASIIRTHLRIRDVLARYGGEEFAAILINTDASTAFEIADRIRECIAQQAFDLDDDRSINVTISIGMATLPNPAPTGDPKKIGEELIRQADEHLYLAKTKGRNCVSHIKNHNFATEPA